MLAFLIHILKTSVSSHMDITAKNHDVEASVACPSRLPASCLLYIQGEVYASWRNMTPAMGQHQVRGGKEGRGKKGGGY